MEALAGALMVGIFFFFVGGGVPMIVSVYNSKAEVARERRMEAEARLEEARIKCGVTHEI